MKIVEATIDIAAPRALVWQHLTDFSRYAEWNPFITHAEGDLKEGSLVRFRAAGMPVALTAPITRLEPEAELIWEARFPVPGLQPRYIRQLQTLEDGTTRFINREEFTGRLLPLFIPVINMQANLYAATCEALKRRVEALMAGQRT